jgi:pyridoxamine 5'-phosphate oxidase family protein
MYNLRYVPSVCRGSPHQGGYMGGTGHSDPRYIRVKPDKKWSWGIEEPIFVEGRFNVKKAKGD